MTADDFRQWRRAMGLTQVAAAEALGLSLSALVQYEAGRRKGSGDPVTIPLTVGLACAALAMGLPPWSAPIDADPLPASRRGRPKEA